MTTKNLLMTAPAAGGGPFDPFDAAYPTATHAFWAGDPDWTDPGDGNAVSSWRNESGAGDAVQATGSAQPIYRASVAAFNSQPAIEFVSSDRLVVAQTLTQGYQVVIVGNIAGNDQRIVGFLASNNSAGIGAGSGGTWAMVGVTSGVISAGTRDSDPHIFVGICDGASSELLVDNTSIGTATLSTAAGDTITIGTSGTGSRGLVGHAAFVGYYSSAADVSGLLDGLADHYGITIA